VLTRPKSETLLNQVEARERQAIEQLKEAAKQQRILAAASYSDKARVQRMQLLHAEAAKDWQTAANFLPEEQKQKRADYLNNASYDLRCIARYGEALSLYEQSLNIQQDIGNRIGEGTVLNNISQIYRVRGEYPTALKYLEHSFVLFQEIGDKEGETVTSWNIGRTYEEQGDLRKAELHMSKAVQIAEEIGHPNLEAWRKALEALRAKLKGQVGAKDFLPLRYLSAWSAHQVLLGVPTKIKASWPRPSNTSAGLWSCWSSLNTRSWKNAARHWSWFAPRCGGSSRTALCPLQQ
jgi:tetratricopeptide (TPR) repeat protein